MISRQLRSIRQATSAQYFNQGEGDEAMSIIDAAFDLGLPVIEDEALQRLLSGVDIVRKSLNPCIAQWQWYWLGFSGSGGMSPIVMMGNLSG